jgi:hypothetical protein
MAIIGVLEECAGGVRAGRLAFEPEEAVGEHADLVSAAGGAQTVQINLHVLQHASRNRRQVLQGGLQAEHRLADAFDAVDARGQAEGDQGRAGEIEVVGQVVNGFDRVGAGAGHAPQLDRETDSGRGRGEQAAGHQSDRGDAGAGSSDQSQKRAARGKERRKQAEHGDGQSAKRRGECRRNDGQDS